MATIRHARPGDASGIAAVWNPVIRDTLATFTDRERSAGEVAALMRERAEAGHPWLVAEGEDRAVIGFSTCAQFRAGPGYAHTLEHTILIRPEATGRGVGSALIGALAEAAAARGARSLIGGISAENPRAIAFHGRRGFAVVGRIPDAGRKFGRWLDLVLMQRRL